MAQEPLRDVYTLGNVVSRDVAGASIYQGLDTSDDRPVLLKMLSGDDSEARELLNHEAHILERVPDAVALKIVRVVELQGRPAAVIQDTDVWPVRLPSLPPLDEFLVLAAGVADALARVHEAGALHGSVQPGNIWHRPESRTIALTGFQYADILISDPAPRLSASPLHGVLPYMSPEQTSRVNRGVDARSDLYSLGVTLYEMLTGSLPFTADGILGWVHAHVARKPTPIRQNRLGVPESLARIIHKLLNKNPEERYQTARGLAADLKRARESWARWQSIDDFELGLADGPLRFRLPSQLFGRQREQALLRDAFESVERDRRIRAVEIFGYSGIGKSALVGSLAETVAERQGFLIQGKAEQYQRDLPYFALAACLADLTKHLLSKSQPELALDRAALQEAVGQTGQALIDLVPELGLILGPQPELPVLDADAAKNRLRLTFLSFLSVLLQSRHPLVCVLDDLQWADAGTLDLLGAIGRATTTGPLLLVLIYRDQEVDLAHPLRRTLENLQTQIPIDTVELGPLDFASLTELVRGAVGAGPDLVALTQLVETKTDGNPFFVRQFLTLLEREGHLPPEPNGRYRIPALSAISALAISDNVVDLLIHRMAQLPDPLQRTLTLAACIGVHFEAEILATVLSRDHQRVVGALEEAMALGFVARDPARHSWPVRRYWFRHDRIQQAAYALASETDRAGTHRRIARHLTGTYPDGGDQLFQIAAHWNRASACLHAAERRIGLDMNLAAARRARENGAYETARIHAEAAWIFAPDNPWAEEHALAFGILKERAQAEYLCGHLEAAEKHFDLLLTHALTIEERGAVFYLQMKLYQVAGQFTAATEVALKAFAAFAHPAPEGQAALAQDLLEKRARLKTLMGNRPIAGLVDLPPMNNPRQQLLLDLLEASAPPLYMVRPALFPWLAATMLVQSLEQGVTPSSCYAFGIHGLMRAVEGAPNEGHAWAQLAIALNERLNDTRMTRSLLHLLGDHINFWVHPIATDLPILERGFQACRENGDLIYSNYIGFQSPWHLWESGRPLSEVIAYAERYVGYARQTRYDAVYQTIRLEQQLCRALAGDTAQRLVLEGPDFTQAQALDVIQNAQFACGRAYYHILRLVLCYHFDDFVGAQMEAEQALVDLTAALSMPIEVTFHLYHGLTLAAAYERAPPEMQILWRQRLEAYSQRFQSWAVACPENFAHKERLLAGELHRIAGQPLDALTAYDAAIRGARQGGFLQYEALAHECMARLSDTLAFKTSAQFHWRAAAERYRRWGALEKVRQLGEQLPGLGLQDFAFSRGHEDTARSLDLLSVLKSARAISSEMVLPKLIARLLNTALENAGGDRAVLLLAEAGSEFSVAGDIRVDSESEALMSSGGVPWTLIHYVCRTETLVRLEHQTHTHHKFSADPYFKGTQPPCAVLCLPIRNRGTVMGLLYIENRQTPGAFRSEHVSALELLTTQIAISLENARLLENAHRAISIRDEFLSIASHELKTPLTSLLLRLQIIERDLESEESLPAHNPRILTGIRTSLTQAQRLRQLMETLLDVARIRSGALNLKRTRFCLSELAREAVEQLSDSSDRPGSLVTLNLTPLLMGTWDRLRLQQVITNLLSNAWRYAPGRPITVETRYVEGRAALSVSDQGPGIEPEKQEALFERFTHGESTERVSGLGLGLFIVREIVTAHDGTIHVESAPGNGATFTVLLPGGEQA